MPALIYSRNISELAISFSEILGVNVLPAAVMLAVLLATGLTLPRSFFPRYVVFLCSLGLLLWIQGNLFVWDYGLINGQGINWSALSWRGWIDGAVWFTVLLFSLIFYRRFYKIAAFTSLVFIVLQTFLLGSMVVKSPSLFFGENEASPIPPDEIFSFSTNQNVIHIIADGFQSDIFKEIIDEDRAYYSKAFQGFTYFSDTTGSFPTTFMSVPAFLSGEVYRNDIPMGDFVAKTLSSKTILNTAHDKGFDVDLILTVGITKAGKYNTAYVIPTPYTSDKAAYSRARSSLMMDLVLFKVLPHSLKKYIYNNESWLLQPNILKDPRHEYRYFAHDAFLQDLVDKSSASRVKPVYKYIHLATTHAPVVIGSDGSFQGAVQPFTRERLKSQCRFALKRLLVFLNRMRFLGIYDSSLIILHADHGAGQPVQMRSSATGDSSRGIPGDLSSIAGSALPLLMIKKPKSWGPLEFSTNQAALTDIPATVNDLLNWGGHFPGKSVFTLKETENRQRRFYYHKWINDNWQSDFFSHLDEFEIDGSSYDASSWHLGKYVLARDSSLQSARIEFGTEQAAKFLRLGWGDNEHESGGRTFNWALGNSASIIIALPKESVRLHAKVNSPGFEDGNQSVSVLLDGIKIGDWEIGGAGEWQSVYMDLPADKERPRVSEIAFRFRKSLSLTPDANNTKPLALRFESITLGDTEPAPHYEWGTTVKFGFGGNSQKYQENGWNVQENGLTWTSGSRATLIFSFGKTVTRDVKVEAEVSALVSGKLKEQRVLIKANGKPLKEWKIRKAESCAENVIIPHSLIQSGILKLTFDLPEATSPASLGISGDKRVLGLAFHTITLTQ